MIPKIDMVSFHEIFKIKHLRKKIFYFVNLIDMKNKNICSLEELCIKRKYINLDVLHLFDLKNANKYAITYNHVNILEYMYDKDTKYDLEDISIAAKKGYLDVIKFFHSKQIDISESYNSDNRKRNVMNCACDEGKLEVIKYLYENKLCPFNDESLDCAAYSCNLDVIEYVYERNDNMRQLLKNPILNGLWIAIDKMDTKVIEFLYDRGYRANSFELMISDDIDFIKFMYAKGHLFDDDILVFAVEKHRYDIVEFLCEHNIVKSAKGALKIAAEEDFTEIAEYLLYNPNIPNMYRVTEWIDMLNKDDCTFTICEKICRYFRNNSYIL